MNWRAWPPRSHDVTVNSIAATTTTTGLQVRAVLDTRDYPTGVKIPDKQMRQLAAEGRWVRNEWHGEWNYTCRPESIDPDTSADGGPVGSASRHHSGAGRMMGSMRNPFQDPETSFRQRYDKLLPLLGKPQTLLVLAADANDLIARGFPDGINIVARAAGVGPDTVRHGQAKLAALNTPTK